MKYERQTQSALDKLDGALAQLRTLIKRGDQKAALHFMEEGLLKERFEELQNITTLSSTNHFGASGVNNIGTL